ncbi:hypothetical protein DL93DRAFT_766526 [Clavulina sp. PMI_390]|nr:hypothetical protein DL93DRAFT_766526 [Clavulina sp. PMI_390]
MGAMGQAPQSADPELPIVPGPASAAGRLPTRLPAQPTMKPFPKAQPEVPSTAMGAIGAIESRFVNLTYDFKFPTNPDFSPTASSASSALLFTPTNAPVRAYEQSLTSLLTDLDAVDSQGDEDVRHARKELVKRVEAALESLDAVKAAAWAHFKGEEVPAPVPASIPAEAEAEEEEGYVIPEAPVEAEAEPAQTESTPVEEAPAAPAEVAVADEVETQTQPDDAQTPTESEVASVSHTSEVEEPTTAAAAPADAHHDIDADSLGSSPVAVPSDLSDE